MQSSISNQAGVASHGWATFNVYAFEGFESLLGLAYYPVKGLQSSFMQQQDKMNLSPDPGP